MTISKSSNVSKLVILVWALELTGCTQMQSLRDPNNDSNEFYGQPKVNGVHFQQQSEPERVFSVAKDCADRQSFAAPLNFRIDQPFALPPPVNSPEPTSRGLTASSLPLSTGDMVEVFIDQGEGFNGSYVVSPGGTIDLPLIPPSLAAGLTTKQLSNNLELALIRADIFRPATAQITVQVLNWASVEVAVSGAVFQPGRVLINNRHANAIMDERTSAYGDFSIKRLLSEALRAASGVRPDAKLDQILLIRNGWRIEVDMTGILTGQRVDDYSLIAGDRIIVPSTGCFQAHLVRPSQITPKGFRVFMSNLIDSADSNSGASIGRYATNLPYGTKLLQAAVSANCVGGKEWTNAPRKVLLASKHPISGETQVIKRSVEQLLRSSSREDINPYLMPNDAVACYDSEVTNIQAVANVLADIVVPFSLF